MRKHRLLTLLFLPVIFLVEAQSGTATVYGFRRRSTGGMQQRSTIDETGKQTKLEPEKIFQYAIYLTSPSKKTRIYPVQLWLNGKAYAVKTSPVTATELEQRNQKDGHLKQVLTKANGAIWKVTPVSGIADTSTKRYETLAKENAVVVLYKTGGKLEYGVLKKFTDLGENVLQ